MSVIIYSSLSLLQYIYKIWYGEKWGVEGAEKGTEVLKVEVTKTESKISIEGKSKR